MSSRRRHLRAAISAILLGTLALAAGVFSAPPSAADPPPRSAPASWEQFHQGPDKTGWNSVERTLSPENVGGLVAQWSAGGNGVTGSPIVVGDLAYVVSMSFTDTTEDFSLLALRLSDGAVVWSSRLDSNPIYPPGAIAHSAGLVLVSSGPALYAYSADTGRLVWVRDVGYSRGATVSGATSYLATAGVAVPGSPNVYALDTATGATRWSTTLPGEISAVLAVSEGQVFVPVDNFLYALDASTGAVRWVSQLGDATGAVYGGGAAVHKGMAYVATTDGVLFAFDAGTGALRWTQPAGDDIHSVPAVDKKTVYIGSIDSHVHAFNARNGSLKWVQSLGGGEIWSSIAVANGVLYLDTDDDNAFALDARSGAVLWSEDRQGTFADMGSAAVVNGRLYMPFGGSGLVAFGLP